MPAISLYQWATRDVPRTWTHILGGPFADPQRAGHNASDLFCYDRTSGTGKFLATARNGRLDDGVHVAGGPHEVGGSHRFNQRWTHIAHVGRLQLLFYDASAGVAELHRTDERSTLTLQRRYSGWRPSWTHIVPGRFGKAQMLLYDASNGRAEFHSVAASGEIKLVRSYDGWRTSWHAIVTGSFANSQYDDLLFYDKAAGAGAFYRVGGSGEMKVFSQHDNWRTTWAHVVAGQFLETAAYDGLLFYEDHGGHTEVYTTDGGGNISQIQARLGSEWALPWKAILAGTFIGDIAPIATCDLVGYDARGGVLRCFHVQPTVIDTLLDLGGRWADGGTAAPVITVNGTQLHIDMSAHHRPVAYGSIVDSQTISVTFPDDATYSGTLHVPGTIRWSNGSAWTKVAGKTTAGSRAACDATGARSS